jgi:hypothetical protein
MKTYVLFLLLLLAIPVYAQREHTLLFTSHIALGPGIVGASYRYSDGNGTLTGRNTNAGFGIEGNTGVHYLLKDRFAPGLKFQYGGIVGGGTGNPAILSLLFGSNFLFPFKDKLSAHAGAYIGPGFLVFRGRGNGWGNNGWAWGNLWNQVGFTTELSGGLSYRIIEDLAIDGGLKYQFVVGGRSREFFDFVSNTSVEQRLTLDTHFIGFYAGVRYFLDL